MYSHSVVFLHVLSALVWVGGMIAIRIAVHPALQQIENPALRLGKTLEITGRLFHLVIPFILLLLATGTILAVASHGHHGEQRWIFFSKESIWTLMTLNFLYMYRQRRAGWKLWGQGKLPEAKAKVRHLPNLLLPLNIILGMVALYLGITLRGL